jgi:hypothetical protein
MFEELTSLRIDTIIIMITSCTGTTQVFKKKSKDYIVPLLDTIKSYWNIHNFDEIQNLLEK